MATFKEIVTKAIIGKGKKNFIKNYTVVPEIVPNTVLGCWVINHNFQGKFNDTKIIIDGSFDVNLWYSHDNDTKTSVVTKNIVYQEIVMINTKDNVNLDQLSLEKEIIVRSLKQPNCVKVNLNNNNIDYTIEFELGIEVIGDTKVRIAVENDEETWEIITDDVSTADVNAQIEKEVVEDFIKDKE